MIEIKNVVIPAPEQMNFIIKTMLHTYGVEDTAESESDLGCSERMIWGEKKIGDLLCKDCDRDMITGSCPGVNKRYILGKSDMNLLKRDKIGFISYVMVYFTITGSSDFIRNFVNFDLFLDGCDDVFHTILEPHFVKHDTSVDTDHLYQECHVMINYSALSNMHMVYKDSKDENWQHVCKLIQSLPYSDLITSRAGD